MRNSFLICAIAWAFPAALSSQQYDSVTSRVIAPGVTHKRIVQLSGPWRVNLLEIDLRQPGISLRGVKAKDSFIGREKVSSMVARYTGSGKVVGAVNTDFFNVKTGESENNVVIEGELSKGVTVSDSPYDKFNTLHSELGIDWTNHPWIERFGLKGTITYGTHKVKLDGLNFRPPYENYTALYTTFVGDSSPSDTLHRDVAYVPLKFVSRNANNLTYRIGGSVHDGSRASLSTGGLLVAAGARRNELRAMARRGGTIRVTTALVPAPRKSSNRRWRMAEDCSQRKKYRRILRHRRGNSARIFCRSPSPYGRRHFS